MSVIIISLSGIALCQPLESDSTLKPTILKTLNGDYRCFDSTQYSDIVNRIANELYCDSIHNINSQTVSRQDSIIRNCKSIIGQQRVVIDADEAQIDNMNGLNKTLINDLAKAQKKIKRLDKVKWFFGAMGVVVSSSIYIILK